MLIITLCTGIFEVESEIISLLETNPLSLNLQLRVYECLIRNLKGIDYHLGGFYIYFQNSLERTKPEALKLEFLKSCIRWHEFIYLGRVLAEGSKRKKDSQLLEWHP